MNFFLICKSITCNFIHHVEIFEDVPSRLDSTLESGSVNNIKLEVFFLQFCCSTVRFGNSGCSERNINPASKAIFDVPLALTMTNQNKSVNLLTTNS
jgi:hypothetical protein